MHFAYFEILHFDVSYRYRSTRQYKIRVHTRCEENELALLLFFFGVRSLLPSETYPLACSWLVPCVKKEAPGIDEVRWCVSNVIIQVESTTDSNRVFTEESVPLMIFVPHIEA